MNWVYAIGWVIIVSLASFNFRVLNASAITLNNTPISWGLMAIVVGIGFIFIHGHKKGGRR